MWTRLALLLSAPLFWLGLVYIAALLVTAYAWRSVLSHYGIFQWLVHPFGSTPPGYGLTGAVINHPRLPVAVPCDLPSPGHRRV